MKKIRLTAFLLPFRPTGLFISVLAISTLIVLQQARSAEWKLYFGNLHSHTAASDGVDNATVAYGWAHTEGHLNFLCLSEHNHMTTQTGLLDNQAAADAAVSVDFVGLVGQEYSTLPPNGGNHVNIHDLLTPVPASLNNDYRTVFHTFLPNYIATHPDAIVVCQFNHPDNPDRDYGAAAIGGFPNYQGDPNGFLAEVDPWVSLIAVISGPADSNMKKSETPPRDTHQDTTARMLTARQKYLERGWHLSPVGDQDNHRHSWGTRQQHELVFGSANRSTERAFFGR